jgi:hypothetical protein
MALHPVKLPKSAARLLRVVVLQKKLLKALCEPTMNAATIDLAWLQCVWRNIDPEWVRRFCPDGKKSPLPEISTMAASPLTARQALFDEFCRQNRVAKAFHAGGDFRDICDLGGMDPALVHSTGHLFKLCYERLSHKESRGWSGYEFAGHRCISNSSYKNDFTSIPPTTAVCPYCDGDIGTPKLDHYLCKSRFPLLACSPWNLVPVCSSCNELAAKGDRLALTPGAPNSMADWLHPFFRAASTQVQIRLSGAPNASIPILESPNTVEQIRLNNHSELIRTLSDRWTKRASAFFDGFVNEVKRKSTTGQTADDLVRVRLDDFAAERGREPFSLIRAAVCQAVLDRRTGYCEEFSDSNPVRLI